MSLKFFDAHTHIQFAAFNSDYTEVIKRAFDEGIGIVNVGTEKSTSLGAIKLTEEYPENVYAAVGLHPTHTSKSHHDIYELGDNKEIENGEIFDYDFYRSLALNKKVVAIGECGLDYYRINDKEMKIKQMEVFVEQIKLAYEIKKPLMIHCRDAYSDLIKILETSSNEPQENPGIIHFFSGNIEDAKKLLEMGFYFTFGGVITFVRDYDEVIKFIPFDKILSETDAPYVAPVPYRGKRNESAYVIEIVKKLAEIKEIEFEKMREQILSNTNKIFNLE